MSENKKVYQMRKVEKDLVDLKDGQKAQAQILGDMSNVLKEIGKAMKNFSEINNKQIRQGAIIRSLESDSKEFKQFMKNSFCSRHDAEIKALNKSDDSQNKNTATLIIGFFVALATGLMTWFVTRG